MDCCGGHCGNNGYCGSETTAPGSSCNCASDCNPGACTSAVGCVNEGSGAICACTCNWGTDCESGCCRPVVGQSYSVCAAASNCAAIGQRCSIQGDCLNNNCNPGEKTYCYDFSNTSGAVCGCGCSSDSQCQSNCCAVFSNSSTSWSACGDSSSWACNGG